LAYLNKTLGDESCFDGITEAWSISLVVEQTPTTAKFVGCWRELQQQQVALIRSDDAAFLASNHDLHLFKEFVRITAMANRCKSHF
jgi:hypothetical protein